MATADRRGRTARTAGKGVTPHRDNRGNRCTALGGVSTVSDPPSTFDTPISEVIVRGPGDVGATALRAVLKRPEFSAEGCGVYSDASYTPPSFASLADAVHAR